MVRLMVRDDANQPPREAAGELPGRQVAEELLLHRSETPRWQLGQEVLWRRGLEVLEDVEYPWADSGGAVYASALSELFAQRVRSQGMPEEPHLYFFGKSSGILARNMTMFLGMPPDMTSQTTLHIADNMPMVVQQYEEAGILADYAGPVQYHTRYDGRDTRFFADAPPYAIFYTGFAEFLPAQSFTAPPGQRDASVVAELATTRIAPQAEVIDLQRPLQAGVLGRACLWQIMEERCRAPDRLRLAPQLGAVLQECWTDPEGTRNEPVTYQELVEDYREEIARVLWTGAQSGQTFWCSASWLDHMRNAMAALDPRGFIYAEIPSATPQNRVHPEWRASYGPITRNPVDPSHTCLTAYAAGMDCIQSRQNEHGGPTQLLISRSLEDVQVSFNDSFGHGNKIEAFRQSLLTHAKSIITEAPSEAQAVFDINTLLLLTKPYHSDARLLTAISKVCLAGRYFEAAEDFATMGAVTSYGSSAESYRVRSAARVARNNLEAAETDLVTAEQLAPGSWKLHGQLRELAIAQRRPDDFIRATHAMIHAYDGHLSDTDTHEDNPSLPIKEYTVSHMVRVVQVLSQWAHEALDAGDLPVYKDLLKRARNERQTLKGILAQIRYSSPLIDRAWRSSHHIS